jgi:hypothetical protein
MLNKKLADFRKHFIGCLFFLAGSAIALYNALEKK